MSSDSPSFPLCGQCHFSHPQLPDGQKCPMAKAPMSQEERNIEADIGSLTLQLKNILMSQISQKGIKDVKKLTSYSIIEFTKILQNYQE
jgi:hypothetical protein